MDLKESSHSEREPAQSSFGNTVLLYIIALWQFAKENKRKEKYLNKKKTELIDKNIYIFFSFQ